MMREEERRGGERGEAQSRGQERGGEGRHILTILSD